VIRCPCKYCAQNVERRASLRRRNPDDLERLEKIVEVREIYKETGSLKGLATRFGVSYPTIEEWVAGITPLQQEKSLRQARPFELKYVGSILVMSYYYSEG